MTSHVRHRRLYDPAATFPPLEPGELAPNTADRQIFMGDSGGAVLPALAVRVFSVNAQYAAGDLAAYGGTIWTAIAAIPPGPWNAAQWTKIAADVSGFVHIAGDTMTGPLVLASPTPSSPNEAAAKAYVDAKVGSGLQDAPSDGASYGRDNAAWTRVVSTAGDTMTGPLVLPSGDPPSAQAAASKAYVDAKSSGGIGDAPTNNLTFGRVNAAWGRVVSLFGDSMGGPLVLSGDPTAALGACTKQYADAINAALTAEIPPPSNVPPTGDAASAVIGASTQYARADHVHPTSTAGVDYPRLPPEVQMLPMPFVYPGKPNAGVMINVPIAMGMTVAAALTGSIAYANTAPTSNAVFTLYKVTTGVATSIGTVTITAGSKTGFALAGSGATLNFGDVLQLVAPTTPDATISDVGIVIMAKRNDHAPT